MTAEIFICSGILKERKPLILPCRKCRKRRKHRILERYDSFLAVCKKCGSTKVSA